MTGGSPSPTQPGQTPCDSSTVPYPKHPVTGGFPPPPALPHSPVTGGPYRDTPPPRILAPRNGRARPRQASVCVCGSVRPRSPPPRSRCRAPGRHPPQTPARYRPLPAASAVLPGLGASSQGLPVLTGQQRGVTVLGFCGDTTGDSPLPPGPAEGKGMGGEEQARGGVTGTSLPPFQVLGRLQQHLDVEAAAGRHLAAL